MLPDCVHRAEYEERDAEQCAELPVDELRGVQKERGRRQPTVVLFRYHVESEEAKTIVASKRGRALFGARSRRLRTLMAYVRIDAC